MTVWAVLGWIAIVAVATVGAVAAFTILLVIALEAMWRGGRRG